MLLKRKKIEKSISEHSRELIARIWEKTEFRKFLKLNFKNQSQYPPNYFFLAWNSAPKFFFNFKRKYWVLPYFELVIMLFDQWRSTTAQSLLRLQVNVLWNDHRAAQTIWWIIWMNSWSTNPSHYLHFLRTPKVSNLLVFHRQSSQTIMTSSLVLPFHVFFLSGLQTQSENSLILFRIFILLKIVAICPKILKSFISFLPQIRNFVFNQKKNCTKNTVHQRQN